MFLYLRTNLSSLGAPAHSRVSSISIYYCLDVVTRARLSTSDCKSLTISTFVTKIVKKIVVISILTEVISLQSQVTALDNIQIVRENYFADSQQ